MVRFPGFRLRKKKEEQEAVEEGLARTDQQTVDIERRLYERLVSLRAEYRVLESYPLHDPWSRALILERKSDGSLLYYVDEIPLTEEEQEIYKKILDILYWELEPAPEGVDPREHFRQQATSIIRRFAIRFRSTIHPGISWGKIEYYIIRNTIEYDVITPLMKDPAIEDISCDGVGRPIYVWHQRYESMPTNIRITKEEELDSLVVKLAHKAGKHVSVAFPIVDAILPEGHRLAATYKKEVSKHGSTFTIRKFREKPLSIVNLIQGGTVSSLLAAYFWKILEYNMTGLIMGVTGAGKTTMLNAIATLLRPNIKIVTIEDTPELRLTHENWVQLYSRPSYGFEAGMSEITLYDLVRVSLRYRPDVLIVGETRGEEAKVLFQAIASVSWDTPVLIRESGTGRVMLVPIGMFVDMFYVGEEERIAKEVLGYEVLSHDGYQARWEPIQYVLRHEADTLYRITGEDGALIEATGNHSVFTIDPETLEIREKRADQLEPGDLLVALQGSPRRVEEPVLALQAIGQATPATAHTTPGTVEAGSEDEAWNAVWEASIRGVRASVGVEGEGYTVRMEGGERRVPAAALRRLAGLSRVALPGELEDALRGDLAPASVAARVLELVEDEGRLEGEALELYTRVHALLSGDVQPLRVLSVERVPNRYRYVYDISVPGGESFFGGRVPVLLHNTGHGGITTIHAEHIDAAVKRLTSPPMDIPPGYIPLVNFALAIKRVRIPTGGGTSRVVRRVTDVWEIRDYEDYIVVSRWDPATREHMVNLEDSILLPRIAELTGQDVSEILDDVYKREIVLRWMAVKDIAHYEEVASKIMEYYRRPDKLVREAKRDLERLESYT